MVTGVETAGLVLATFPLVVEALSHYVNGLQKIKSWRKFRLVLEKYARQVKNQQVWYLDTLEQLFDGIVKSDEELAELVKDPAGDVWRRAEYETRLRLRLDHSYDHYMLTLKHMMDTVTALAAKVAVSSSGKISWDERSLVKGEMKKLKVVLSKEVYMEHLNDIDKANKDLREFTRQSLYLEPVRQKRRSKSLQADFKLIRRHATSLYNVVVMGRSWSCKCKDSHMASLLLEPRTDWGRMDAVEKLRFRILLFQRPPNGKPGMSPAWREVEAKPVEEIQLSVAKMGSREVVSTKTHQSSRRGSPPMPPPKRIRFVSPSRSPEQRLPKSPMRQEVASRAGPIMDLCTILYGSYKPPRDLGFLLDEGAIRNRHHLHLLSQDETSTDIRTQSLASLLEQSEHYSNRCTLKRGDRLYIAVTLASSVLQLDRTSWLRRQWRSSDVRFYFELNSAPTKFALNHPYLSWRLSSEDHPSIHSTPESSLKRSVTRSEPLLALGFTLMELSFGRTLLQMQKPEDEDPDEMIARLNSARRLLNDVYDESGENYGDVVRRCLDCPFDFRDLSLDNDDFQKAVFDTIVTPLIKDLDAFKGTSARK